MKRSTGGDIVVDAKSTLTLLTHICTTARCSAPYARMETYMYGSHCEVAWVRIEECVVLARSYILHTQESRKAGDIKE